jgi:hypothetical protein
MNGFNTSSVLDEVEGMPSVFALTGPAVDFHRVVDRYHAWALCGYIHQHRFHLTVIRALDDIERYAKAPSSEREATAVRRCSSCGAAMARPPLCTRCRLYF